MQKILMCMLLTGASALIAKEEDCCSNSSPVCLESTWMKNECAYNGFVRVGFIAEQMRITGTEVSITQGAATDFSIGGNSVEGLPQKINPVKFDLDVGLTVGLGYLFDQENYTITADFEWLSSKGKVNTGGTTYVYESSSPVYNGTISPNFSGSNAYLKVDYFLLDIALSKGYYVSNRFSYQPFAGIKAAWIYYDSLQTFTIADTPGIPSNTAWLKSNDVDFWGVGPLAGMEANYYFNKEFSIYSCFNTSVLLGESTLTNAVSFYPEGTEDAVRAKENLVVATPTIRATLGLQYDCQGAFEHDECIFRVGFDGRYYFNQYPVANSLDTYVRGNVTNNAYSMVGLIVDATWRF